MIKRILKYFILCLFIISFIFLNSCGDSDSSDRTDLPGELYQQSAYEIAVSLGYEGSKEEWLASLNGEDGREVELSTNFDSIVWRYVGDDEWKSLIALEELKGSNGKSAFEIAKEFGYKGDENEWLDSLKGQNGINGKEVEFNVSLTHIEWRYVGDKEWKQLIDLKTLQGKDGLSAYEIYLKYYPDYNKSEEEWINDLINGNLGYKEQYSVTFNKNNGESIYLSYYDKGSLIEEPEVPVKPGYTFVEWYYEKEDVRWLFDIFTVETDITLTAEYVINRYNINYDFNGGYVEHYMPYSYEDPFGVELPNPQHPDEFVVFDGWYLTSDFRGEPVTRIDPFTGKNIFLYAKWKTLEIYTITYELNGGKNASNAPSYYDDEKGTELINPTKSGCIFDGWYLTEDFSTLRITKIDANTGKNITLYAKWKYPSVIYPIYFNLNGGEPLIDYPLSYDSSIGLDELPVPKRANFTFAGWYIDSALTSGPVTKVLPGTVGEVNLYAKWIKDVVTYKITYICEGGILPVDAPNYYIGGVGCILPVPTPSIDGESFLGWYDASTNAQIDRIPSSLYRDITLVAKFGVKKTYVPKWELNQIGFNGNGMTYEILVNNKKDYDPFDNEYNYIDKKVKQTHQNEVEDAYDIVIKYSNYPDAAYWGPERVKYINKMYLNGTFGDVYVVEITSNWIPTLVKAGTLAALYDINTNSGIFTYLSNEFDDYSGYIQNDLVNQATSISKKVYGYSIDKPRPDYFMYYNADKVASLNLEDPAELWMKGEWNITKLDEWVKTAQKALNAEDEYVLDMGFAESIIGMTAAVGNRMTKVNPPILYLTNQEVTSTIETLQNYYHDGFYTNRGVQDVTSFFQDGRSLLHHGYLLFMKNEHRFNPAELTFTIGVVPYPTAYGEGGIPVTTNDSSEGIIIGPDEYLKDISGNYIKTVDMGMSTFKVPYTATNCYSIIDTVYGKNGMNAELAMYILHDLVGGLGDDPNVANQLTDDQIYRKYLENKFDREIDVEVIMSCQDNIYFESIELLSMTVGGGSHFGDGGLWPLAANMVKSTDSPLTAINEVIYKYEQAMRDLGYTI